MKNNVRILSIAPYKELGNNIKSVGAEFEDIDLTLFTADLKEAVTLIDNLDLNAFDVILSRGGTADLIREFVKLPVIDISISIYDILSAIKLGQNYTDNFAIVGYASITEPAHLLCEILGYKITILTLNEDLEVDNALNSLINKDYELILCDVITNQTALSKGLNTLLITSGLNSIRNAIMQSIDIARYLRTEKVKSTLFETLLYSSEEKYLLTNINHQKLFSTLDDDIEQVVLAMVHPHEIPETPTTKYFTHQNHHYYLTESSLQCFENPYIIYKINESTKPKIEKNIGIDYLTINEVDDLIKDDEMSQFVINDQISDRLLEINKYHQPLIIYGEFGSGKTTVAYKTFITQSSNQKNLIIIDGKQLDDRMWKFLVNATNGPLVSTGNTIFLKNVEELIHYDLDKFLTIVQNTRLLKRNSLIFSFNSTNDIDKYALKQITTHLKPAQIHVQSIANRKNELNIISTILLNRINIEYGKDIVGFDPEAFKVLLTYDWPGNFDQLEKVMRNLVIDTHTHYISANDISEALKNEDTLMRISKFGDLQAHDIDTHKQLTLFDYNQEIIRQIMNKNNQNQTKTAAELGISRTTLWRYLKNE